MFWRACVLWGGHALAETAQAYRHLRYLSYRRHLKIPNGDDGIIVVRGDVGSMVPLGGSVYALLVVFTCVMRRALCYIACLPACAVVQLLGFVFVARLGLVRRKKAKPPMLP